MGKFLNYVAPVVSGLVEISRTENPAFTPEQIEDDVEGDIKHFLRKKIGWVVDILYALHDFRKPLREMIAKAVAETPAEVG